MGVQSMRAVLSVLVACIAIICPAYGANNQVQIGPAPGWVTPSQLLPVPDGASGLLFVRRNDVLVHLDRRGQTQYQGFRVRILHPNALELGNLSIAWNPFAGAPLVHGVRVHRGNETIDVLKSSSFEVLRREDQLEAASLNGVLTAIMRIPDLRVGDELEVSWSARTSDPTLGPNDAGLIFLAPSPSPGRFAIGVSWENGQEPRFKMTPDMAAAADRSPGALTFRFDNPPMVIAPDDVPPRYKWQRFVEYSDFGDWAAVSRHFAPLFSQASRLSASSSIKQEAKRIAGVHSSAFDRASAALALVQRQVRYIYVGLDGGNLKPATAEETWRRRYGDCKGKTVLLMALLGELGIQAEPVLVSNAGIDDGLDARLPNPGLFDHVLVRARVGADYYWLDGTLPDVAGPSRAPVVPYRWTLPLTAAGNVIERVPWSAPARPDTLALYEIDARTGFDHPARITTTNITRGIKGLAEQAQFSALTREQLLGAFRQQATGNTWQSIEDVQWRYDVKAQASILTVSGTGEVDWDDDGGGAKSLSLPGGGFNPPERRARQVGPFQNLPYYTAPEFSCHVTTVRLPASTPTSQWSFNSTFDDRRFGRRYYRNFELRDGAIRMVRGSRIDQPEIDATAAARDNAKIASFDNSMAVIRYRPKAAGASARSAGPDKVPATYEIDWTGDDVPCLPAAAN